MSQEVEPFRAMRARSPTSSSRHDDSCSGSVFSSGSVALDEQPWASLDPRSGRTTPKPCAAASPDGWALSWTQDILRASHQHGRVLRAEQVGEAWQCRRAGAIRRSCRAPARRHRRTRGHSGTPVPATVLSLALQVAAALGIPVGLYLNRKAQEIAARRSGESKGERLNAALSVLRDIIRANVAGLGDMVTTLEETPINLNNAEHQRRILPCRPDGGGGRRPTRSQASIEARDVLPGSRTAREAEPEAGRLHDRPAVSAE